MPLYQCSAAQYSGFLAYFNRNSNNGVMGINELKSALARAGVSASTSDVHEMIGGISVDSAGINFQGFIDYVCSYTAFRDVETEYAEAFRLYDRNGTGSLSRDDIAYVMSRLGLKIDLESLFNEVDINRDGVIEYDEFVTMMKKTHM